MALSKISLMNCGGNFTSKKLLLTIWGLCKCRITWNNSVLRWFSSVRDIRPKNWMKLTIEQTLTHNGHPVLRWMMDNIFIRRDPAGNIKPNKEKSTEKIDGAVAMIMALDRAIRCGCVSDESVYN